MAEPMVLEAVLKAGAQSSGGNAAAAPTGRSKAARQPAPGTDVEGRRLRHAVLASRLCGGGTVKLQADGTITIEVRHSMETPPPVVEKAKSLQLAELAVVEQRQQQWAAKASAKAAHTAAAPAGEPSKRARKRAAARKKAAEKRAAQDTQIQELQNRLAAASVKATTTTTSMAPARQPASLPELAQRAIDDISRRAKARGGGVVAQHAVLGAGEEPRPVIVPAGTVGAATTPEGIGSIVLSELHGKTEQQLEQAVDRITAKLFAQRTMTVSFGGESVPASSEPIIFGAGGAGPRFA